MKPWIIILIFTTALSVSVTTAAEDHVTPLKLIHALPVEGPENNQPSGLTIRHDTLFAVSDKHDDTIFRVALTDSIAVFVPHLKFDIPEPAPRKRLDFEGITCDAQGAFYLVSETAFRILRVSADGEQVSWITPSLRPIGEQKGLFRTRGAYLEGIALLGPDHFLVCAERQPRGLIEVDRSVEPFAVRVFNYDKTTLSLPEGRSTDFSDLFRANGDLFVLQRNAEVISNLIYGGPILEEKDVWSFGHIVHREDLRYSNMKYGLAEGLCMDAERIYLILDNNGDCRASNPDDRRPLLLIMKRP
ncbi:MAG: esterase-like activity of phytase family protein [Candidatus Latescibacteria bacterium]|nr:esterase-like activity of phytase family protein [Candidatus Latescibacterota bacterium]